MLELAAKVRLSEEIDSKTGRRTVHADILNVGESEIARIALAFEYEYECPQDVSSEFQRPPGRSIRVLELGRQIEFLPFASDDGSLQVGQSRTYLLPSELLSAVESIIASLSPERYRLMITMNGRREVAVPGEILGGFVQQFAAEEATAENAAMSEQESQAKEASLTQKQPIAAQTHLVDDLFQQIIERGGTIEVLPPVEITRDGGVFEREAEFQRLAETNWRLRFGDGQEADLPLRQLMSLLFRLVTLRWQYDELRRTGGLANGLPVVIPVNLAVSQVMAGDQTRVCLSGLSVGEL